MSGVFYGKKSEILPLLGGEHALSWASTRLRGLE